MSVQGVNAQGFTMNFDVNVSNPNSVELPLASADYKLGTSGVNLLDGKAKPEGTLPAGGARTVALPVMVTFENLLAAEKAIQSGGGNVPYDLAGDLTFDTGTPLIGQLRVPLSYSGTLSLRDILKDPKALFGSEAAKRLAAIVLSHLPGS
jgi:LEA14-like dessication related protein